MAFFSTHPLRASSLEPLVHPHAALSVTNITIMERAQDVVVDLNKGVSRETFFFFDPVNYLRIDNDVWAFGPVRHAHGVEVGAAV